MNIAQLATPTPEHISTIRAWNAETRHYEDTELEAFHPGVQKAISQMSLAITSGLVKPFGGAIHVMAENPGLVEISASILVGNNVYDLRDLVFLERDALWMNRN